MLGIQCLQQQQLPVLLQQDLSAMLLCTKVKFGMLAMATADVHHNVDPGWYCSTHLFKLGVRFDLEMHLSVELVLDYYVDDLSLLLWDRLLLLNLPFCC